MKSVAALSPHAEMTRTIEAIGAAGVDIVPLYFERFFARYPAQLGLFHNRASSQGAMVNEMLTMLLAQGQGEDWVPTMMRAQVTTHFDHGDIELTQYRGALDLLVEVLGQAAGRDWNAAQATAWQAQADRLYALIARYF